MPRTRVNLPADRPRITYEQMIELIDAFSERLTADPTVAEKLIQSRIVFRFAYWDDDWGQTMPSIVVDCREGGIDRWVGLLEENDFKVEAELTMHSLSAHMFWMQKLNLMAAVTRQEMLVKGALQKLMRLLPVIRPGYGYYRETLERLGHVELLNFPTPKPTAAPEPAPEAPRPSLWARFLARIKSLFRRKPPAGGD